MAMAASPSYLTTDDPSPYLSWLLCWTAAMGQAESRAVFDNLITRNHVEHALALRDEQHNLVPMALATVVLLDGSPAQLRQVYYGMLGDLEPWTIAPETIADLGQRQQHLGDVRYQRAFMDYFSIQHGQLRGNSQQLAMSQLKAPEQQPLVHGLFGAGGLPLLLLGDAVELRSPILLVESLVLAAVDWDGGLSAILEHPQLAAPADEAVAPDAIIASIAYDGRFSGLMRSGPGFAHVSSVLANLPARAAVIDYVHRLDVGDPASLLDRLASLSVLLLCGTHKKGQPAFDFHLATLPALVQALKVVLARFDDAAYRLTLIRGVWLLIVLCYVTQLRPVLDPSLLSDVGGEVAGSSSGSGSSSEGITWDAVFAEFHDPADSVQDKYEDPHFLRSLRSIYELRLSNWDKESFFLHAAWKLKSQWTRWIGQGQTPREETLNIRL